MDKAIKEHYRLHYYKAVERQHPDWLPSQIIGEVAKLMAELESGKKPKISFMIAGTPKQSNVKPYIF